MQSCPDFIGRARRSMDTVSRAVPVRIQYAAALNLKVSLGVVSYSERAERSRGYRTRLTVRPRPTSRIEYTLWVWGPNGWGRLGAARARRRRDPSDGHYLDEEATASLRWIFSAADSISSTTASG